jgi:hypothetical protein
MGNVPSDDAKVGRRGGRFARVAFLLACAAATVAGCSGSLGFGGSEEAPPASYQVYLTRMRNSRVEFEQYRGVPGGVFIECGTVVQGEPQPREQGISPVSGDQEELVTEKAREVMEQSGEGVSVNHVPPTQFDQAILTLKIDARVVEIRTSIESLADAESDKAVAVKELLELIRGLPEHAPCGNEGFALLTL